MCNTNIKAVAHSYRFNIIINMTNGSKRRYSL